MKEIGTWTVPISTSILSNQDWADEPISHVNYTISREIDTYDMGDSTLIPIFSAFSREFGSHSFQGLANYW